MGFFGRKSDEEQKTTNSMPLLSEESTIREWLEHPVGGEIFRAMLAEAGQNEKVLTPVKGWSLKRVAGMSKGRMTDDMIADMVQRANSTDKKAVVDGVSAESTATAPATDSAAPATPSSQDAEWVERITPDRFTQKTVIVTGAGSGIGQATASRVAREGGRVIAVDISRERLEEFKNSLHGETVEIVAGDITSDDTVAEIIKVAGERIDALANVAGIMDNMTPVHEVTDEVWDRVMGVNVVGTMKLMRAVVPVMLQQQSGSIVNVASEAGLRGSAAGAAYTASKHAVVGLTKSSAFAYTGSGIRVNAVAPGGVATNIEATFDSEMFLDRFGVASAAMPAPTTADQLAASITFLMSDDGTNINGAILPSDGGWSAV